jgi:hypothetical protein
MAKDKSTHWSRNKGKYIGGATTAAFNAPWIIDLAKFFYKDGGRVRGCGKAKRGFGRAMKRKR